jgi:hypothetical protein
MKSNALLILLLFFYTATFAQSSNKDVFAFSITDYIVNTNDSVSIVQIQLPISPVTIELSQLGLLRHNFTNNKLDTSSIGFGKCNLIKGSYYYFGIRLLKTAIKPIKNDIIYTKINYPTTYKGQFYDLIRNAVYFEKITGGKFYEFESALNLDETKEKNLIDLMVNDIKYTGQEMQKMSDNQDTKIEGGLFDGKMLFACMQTITAENVKDFLGYVIVRPNKYAGNTWKIAETFATWATAGTPRVIK